MSINSLTLNKFRNFDKETLSFESRYVFFLGQNAQGKTNLLEAIYYLTCAKSFRTSRISNLVNFNSDYFYLKGISLKNNLADVLEVSFKNGEGRKHKYNGVLLKKGEYPWGIIPTISYSRKDLKLSEEEASLRRKFIDQELSFLSKTYFYHLKRYNRALKQRNAALKNKHSGESEVRLWDEELVVHGLYIIKKRREFIDTLNILSRLAYRRLTGSSEELKIGFRCQLNDLKEKDPESAYRARLTSVYQRERKLGYTLFGPHKDDLEIVINDNDIRQFGSSGQHKSVVLSIKLALIEIVKKESGVYPLLLLDEVFSELDEKRIVSLVQIIKRKKIQVFFSGDHLPACLSKFFTDNTTFFLVSDNQVKLQERPLAVRPDLAS